MKIAILGFDVEGRASFDYFAAQGHDLTIFDQNTSIEVPSGVTSVLGDKYLDDLDQFDLLVRTPGLPPQKILEKNPGVEAKITTHINEFMKAAPTRHIIGVTGTKGKGTTSTLIAKMLEAVGFKVFLGGNIGVPPLSFLPELTPDSRVVLELSSFQLIDLKQSPHYAVCLMVVPEHLNWHRDMAEYVEAKAQLFAHQTDEDLAIYFADNDVSTKIAARSPGQKIPYYAAPGAFVENNNVVIDEQVICGTAELKLLGEHNWQNICAAVTTVWQRYKDVDAIRSVLTTFSGLEHRLEYVRELGGISYYNDSFGTTPETAIAAIQAFQQPEVVILGGQPKGVGFEELGQVIKNSPQVAKALVIGEAKPQIVSALQAAGVENYVESDAQTMPEIVAEATELAKSVGQPAVVLLSTAATSFDMFKNYKDRGEQFKQVVRSLA
jgi:UDP-N-acetylmuramoylalanine--D-glutamate ligase